MKSHLPQAMRRWLLMGVLAAAAAAACQGAIGAAQEASVALPSSADGTLAQPPALIVPGPARALSGTSLAAGQDPTLDSDAAGSVPLQATGPEQVTLVSYSSTLDEPLLPAMGLSAVAPRPPGSKPGAFQQIAFTSTWMPGGGSGLGITDLALQSTFGFPLFTADSPLLLTPAFETQFLDGPITPDLPPRLYDASLQIRHLRKLTPDFGIDLAITPGMHGDFSAHAGREFRLPARAIGAYDWDPDLQIVFGIAYLDREDINWLPVGGVIWTPNDCTRVEAVVPRPRFARRFCYDGITEDWWYVAAEFGGGSYGIERATGTADVATFSDYRILLGLEQKTLDGINGRVEFGYVFWRKVEYLSGTPDFKPDGTFLVRAGVSY